MRRRAPEWKEAVLFIAGLLGVLHETLRTDLERIQLLLLFAAMMGLPALLPSIDRKRKDDDDDPA